MVIDSSTTTSRDISPRLSPENRAEPHNKHAASGNLQANSVLDTPDDSLDV